MSFLHGQNKLLAEARNKPHHVLLNQRILAKNSFVMATISGERQIGKSMYMLIALYDMYGSWDAVFDHLFYTMDDLMNYLIKARESGLRDILIGVDDAGIYFGANQWSVNREGVVLMSGVFDTIGTVVKGCIFTMPNRSNLIKNIRIGEAIVDIRIRQGRHKYDRLAEAYTHTKTPKDQDVVKKIFVDRYDVRIPTSIYERYAKLRDSYSKDTLEKMKSYLNGEKTGVFNKNGNKYTALDIPDDEE